MVIDKIENAKLYAGLGANISKAFKFISNTDLHKIESGKYEIDDGNIFALIQEYDTKSTNDCKLEGHFKFIDVQYIISGVELIGQSTLNNHHQLSKNDEKDIAFYEGNPTFFRMNEGMFAIFFPDDLHMPGIKLNRSSKVKKLVVKIRVL